MDALFNLSRDCIILFKLVSKCSDCTKLITIVYIKMYVQPLKLFIIYLFWAKQVRKLIIIVWLQWLVVSKKHSPARCNHNVTYINNSTNY